jgi:hypothetical protein
MKYSLFLFLLPVLAFTPRPASAQVFVGPNLEWSYWSLPDPFSEDSGDVLSIGGFYLSPGLRLGYLFLGGTLMVSADAGVQSQRLGSFKYTSIIVEPGIAYAFLSERATSPYIGVSSGWHHLSLGDLTRPVIGGALGIRHRVAAGHGFIRGELRYDHFTKKDTKGVLLPENIVGLRVGCDLLLSP